MLSAGKESSKLTMVATSCFSLSVIEIKGKAIILVAIDERKIVSVELRN